MALPPGPNLPSPLQIVGWVTRPKPYLRRARARYGDTFTMRMRPDEQFVVVSHPDAVKEVFTADPEIVRAGEANRILLPVLGKHSVLLLDGPRHLRQRRLLLPPFHGERMQRYEEIITDATEREIATWPSGEALRLAPRLQEVTLDVIMRAVFGLTDDAAIRDLRARLLRLISLDDASGDARRARDDVARPRVGHAQLQARDAPRRRRAAGRDPRAARGARPRRARGHPLHAAAGPRRGRRGPVGPRAARPAAHLLVAGHETTANGLSWAFERLLRTPHAYERAVADARGGDGAYLAATAKEILRMRPVLPIVARRLSRPATIAGHDLPAGCDVARVHLPRPPPRGRLPRARRLPPRALPGDEAGDLYVAAVRRRCAAVHRRVVRAVRDGGGARLGPARRRPARGHQGARAHGAPAITLVPGRGAQALASRAA
jgi:cytochrome P450